MLSAEVRTITTPDELLAIDACPSGNYVLGSDIDVSKLCEEASGWQVLCGSARQAFAGTLDGKGFSITGLTTTAKQQYVALFGFVGKTGTVKNLRLSGVSIQPSECDAVGGIAMSNSGTIEKCIVSGTIEACGSYWQRYSATTDVYVGGICAKNIGNIVRCSFDGNVNVELSDTANASVGGIVATSNGSIERCYAAGSLRVVGAEVYGGGIAGYLYGGYVEDCASHAGISTRSHSGSSDAGGICGRLECVDIDSSGRIARCLVTGSVVASGSPAASGICGYAKGRGSISECVILSPSIVGVPPGLYVAYVVGVDEGYRGDDALFVYDGNNYALAVEAGALLREDALIITSEVAEKPSFYISLGWDLASVWEFEGMEGCIKLRV
ncbi:MAG: hypothetical protein FWG00_00235 [Coriobacteriia bacterium]|nr:hypothetical protein [Coriobacteriia bacterium]